MKIVSLLPSATEIICALGLREYLVGVTHECFYPGYVVGLPIVTESLIPKGLSSQEIDARVKEQLETTTALYSINMPVMQELAPDIIVTQALCEVCAVSEKEVLEAVCELPGNPQVINLEPMSLGDMFDTMLMVGEVTNKLPYAKGVVNDLKKRVEFIRDNTDKYISSTDRLSVAFLEWLDPLFNAGHWTPELIEYAGGANALGNKHKPSTQVSWEKFCETNADVLFVACCGFKIPRTIEDINMLTKTPDWNGLAAVKNKQVYVTDGNAYFSSPGPRLVDSLEILANALYPEVHKLPECLPQAINYLNRK